MPEELPPELKAACQRHLDFVRKNCPGLLPDGPVKPGTLIEPVQLDPKQTQVLVGLAAAAAAGAVEGRRPADPMPDAVVWTDGADSLLVLLGTVRVDTADGLVSVGVDVACDQVPPGPGERSTHVDIDLVVGTAERPTGLLAAASTPRGPAVIVERWHDALVALAWQALLDTAAALSATMGADIDGTRLIPTRWSASANGLSIGAQARHPFDRQPATSRRDVNGRLL